MIEMSFERCSMALATSLFINAAGIGTALAQNPIDSAGSDAVNPASSQAPAETAPATNESPTTAATSAASESESESGSIDPEVIPVATATGEAADAPERQKSVGLGIEEIIVTAEKREESANDVPISISAFTGDDLKTLGVTDTRDLGNLVPGFTATDSGYNTPVYTLRGVGFNDTTYTATSTVGVYVDEVNLPYSIMTKGAQLDLQRVEVLKGPQGILYGRNTTGGAINYIAKKPTDAFEAGFTGTLSRFQTADAEGFVSGPLADALDGRFALKVVKSWEGSQYSATRPDDHLGKQEKIAGRGALAWAPSDDLSVRLTLEAWNDSSEPRAAQVIFVSEQNPLDPLGVFLPPQARNYSPIPQKDASPRIADWSPDENWQLHDRFYSGALRTDWQISDTIKFTGIASHMRVVSDDSSFPQSGYNFNNAEQIINAHIDTTALELRLSGVSGENEDFDWMVGGNASRDTAKEFHTELLDMQSLTFPDPITGTSTLGNRFFIMGKPEVDQYAGFFNVGLHFLETLKLTLGGRYTQTNETYTGCSGEQPDSTSAVPGVSLSSAFTALSAAQALEYTAATLKPGRPTIVVKGQCFSLAEDGSTDPYKDDLNENNFSYRVALDWQPIDDYLFYISHGQGFKAGGYPVLTSSQQSQLEPVTQEKLIAYEIGSKTTFLERQLHVDLALFNYDYKDKQLLTKVKDPVFGPLPVLRNAPKSKVYGAETAIVFAPTAVDGLFITATAAYTHTRIKKFSSFNSDGDFVSFAGKPFNFAPEFQYSLVANYTWTLTDDFNMTASADYYHSSSTNASIEEDPRFDFDQYGLVGARLGISPSSAKWSLTAFGRNLTNELVPVAVYQNGDAVARIAGASLTYGLTLSYNLD